MSRDSPRGGSPFRGGPEGAGPARGSCSTAIVLAYAIAGVAIVMLSGLTTKVYQVPITAQLGLFQLLPATYWLGLVLIAAASVIAIWKGSDGLVAVTGVLLLATLAGTPTLFEPNPRVWDAYVHFASAQDLALAGRLPADPASYPANWPGAFLTVWLLSSTGAVVPMDFLAVYPFLTGGITFLAIFELLRSTFNPAIAREACVPTALFAVWGQFHVSPQSLGFVLFLLILATCRRRNTNWRLVAATLFGGLVVSHPTSAILLLSILGVHATLSSVPQLHGAASREESRRDARFSRRVAITFAIVWLSWLFFLAVGSSEAARFAILTQMENVAGLPEQTVNVATYRTTASLLTWAPQIRLASVGLYGLFGLISLAALFLDRNSRNEFRFVLSALIGLSTVAVADIFAFGGQFYDRSLLLFAVFAPALCFTGLKRFRVPKSVRVALLVVLVGASVATASTTYYLEAFYFVPIESVAAANFVDTLPPGAVVMDGKSPIPVWVDPSERPFLHRFMFSQTYPTPLERLGRAPPVYAMFDPGAEIWYRQWYGTNIFLFYSNDRTNYSLIYDNGWSEIYAVGA